jgi:hypothetical protein
MEKLTRFIAELEARSLHYDLGSHREGAIMVKVAVPGQRWEVEFFASGEVEVEVFESAGMLPEDSIERLLAENSD